MELNRRTAKRFGADGAVVRIFIGDHKHGTADLKFGMTDFSARFGESHQLSGSESSLVKVDRGCGVAVTQVRNDRCRYLWCRFNLFSCGTHVVLAS